MSEQGESSSRCERDAKKKEGSKGFVKKGTQAVSKLVEQEAANVR
jgi:hypothetical protein